LKTIKNLEKEKEEEFNILDGKRAIHELPNMWEQERGAIKRKRCISATSSSSSAGSEKSKKKRS
jgi:hypothetical protein